MLVLMIPNCILLTVCFIDGSSDSITPVVHLLSSCCLQRSTCTTVNTDG